MVFTCKIKIVTILAKHSLVNLLLRPQNHSSLFLQTRLAVKKIVISGTGVYTPPFVISNEELVTTFNQYVQEYNAAHQQEITAGTLEPLKESSSEFIVKASGIKQRYVVEKSGILDPQRMQPILPKRDSTELSLQAEMAVAAAKQALKNANKSADEIDLIVLSCVTPERAFPSVAIEVQSALGAKGYAFDMIAGCSSGTFGLQTTADALRCGHAKSALLVDVELGSCLVDFCDRDSHFIFGDAATAIVLETDENRHATDAFEIVSSKLTTQFSNNIRCDFGLLNRLETEQENMRAKLFRQKGRQVFKEVIPFTAQFILGHLQECDLTPQQITRFWLHQANINMNNLIAEKLLGRSATQEEAPIILDKYANTASAGSVIAFHNYRADLKSGDLGLLCSFGAGYSLGSVIVKKT
jgi:beta-ketodecanoyl-[acyl-carrier-protein] synthase